jgi:prefoldin subunit 5
MSKEFNKIVDQLQLLSIRTQIDRLNPTLTILQEEVKAMEVEKTKAHKAIATVKDLRSGAQQQLNYMESGLTWRSNAFKHLEKAAVNSQNSAGYLVAYEAQLELVKMQSACIEVRVTIHRMKLRVLDLEKQFKDVEKSIRNKVEEVEACHAKIQQLQDILPAGQNNSDASVSDVVEQESNVSKGFKHQMLSLLAKSQGMTMSIEDCVGMLGDLDTISQNKSYDDPAQVTSVDSHAPELAASKFKIEQLKLRIKEVELLFAVGKHTRARCIVKYFRDNNHPGYWDRNIITIGNNIAHGAKVLADVSIYKLYRSALGRSANDVRLEGMYEASVETVWEHRDFLNSSTLLIGKLILRFGMIRNSLPALTERASVCGTTVSWTTLRTVPETSARSIRKRIIMKRTRSILV